MRKYLSLTIGISLALALSGCNSEYSKTLDELDERAELLISAVSEYNEALKTISQMASAIESGDFVTGITKIMSTTDPDKEIGYTINFVKHEPITIIHGINGKVPYIGTERGTTTVITGPSSTITARLSCSGTPTAIPFPASARYPTSRSGTNRGT